MSGGSDAPEFVIFSPRFSRGAPLLSSRQYAELIDVLERQGVYGEQIDARQVDRLRGGGPPRRLELGTLSVSVVRN